MPGLKRIVWIAAAVALLAALGWSFRPRAVPVEVAEVVKGPFAQTVEEDGATRVRVRYAVSAPLAGRLLRVSVKAGDAVQKGGGLAVIVPSAPAMPGVQLASSRTPSAKRASAFHGWVVFTSQ